MMDRRAYRQLGQGQLLGYAGESSWLATGVQLVGRLPSHSSLSAAPGGRREGAAEAEEAEEEEAEAEEEEEEE